MYNMALRKDRNQVRRNFVTFYTDDSVYNWIEENRGFEKRSSFLHRKMKKLTQDDEQG